MSEISGGVPIELIQWPQLPAPYAEALRAAVADVLAHYTPVGLIAGGSILRGEGGPTSDIDLYVIHPAHFRQRLQRIYHGVPFEIFINHPDKIRAYFREEHATRPITAHIFVTGVLLLDRSPVVQELRLLAAKWLATPPNPSVDTLRWRRYLAVDTLDNARDVMDTDPTTARMLLYRVLDQLIEIRFLSANQHLPRTKGMLAALHVLDRDLADDVEQFAATDSLAEQFDLVVDQALRIANAQGFFEWDSQVEIVNSEGDDTAPSATQSSRT